MEDTTDIKPPVDRRSGRTACSTSFPPVLDACCGSRMFWFDPKNPLAVFIDKREEKNVLSDGRDLTIAPDTVADFTALPFTVDAIWRTVT